MKRRFGPVTFTIAAFLFLFAFSLLQSRINSGNRFVSITEAKRNSPTPTPTGPPTVVVDFNTDEGPVTYRAAGFIKINWILNESPVDATYLATKPQLATWMTNFDQVSTAISNNIEFQYKLHKYNTETDIYIPSDINGDWSVWENYVRTQVLEAFTNYNSPTIEFDIWNEPDCCGYWPYGSISETNDDPRYYEMWNRAYRIIKEVNPDYKVVGPSVSYKLSWIKNKFLPRVRTDGTMPDILSWHQIANTNVSQNVSDMRTFLLSNGYGSLPISINEYGNDTNAKKPGVAVLYMYEIEKSRVDSAARACWQEGGNWNCAKHMGNTLNYDFVHSTYPADYKRSVYWAYHSYAQMAGRMLSVGVTQATVGVASEDDINQKGYVLLGNIANAGTILVNLKNLHLTPFYSPGNPIQVIVSRIPNSESNALTAPVVIQQENMLPNGTQLTLTIPNAGIYEAYTIQLQPADPNAPTPTVSMTPTPTTIPSPTQTPAPTATPTVSPTAFPTFTPSPTAPVDSQPPEVFITNPLQGANVPTNSTIVIAATASDNIGVAKVLFYVNSKLKCTDFTAPFTCAWLVPSSPSGYTVQARAYDAANNISTNQISITSSN